jgi:hypothetical protein
MAFVYADPFASYSATADMAKGGWSIGSTPVFTASNGRFGLGSLRMTSESQSASKAFAAVTGNVILSFDMLVEAADPDAGKFLEFYNNGGTALVLTIANNVGEALLVYNAANTLVHTSPAGTLSREIWHRIEIEAQVGSASGIVKVWVDGALVVNISAVDLTDGSAAGCDRVVWIDSPDTADFNYKFGSVIISDTSGAAPWNAALGDKRMYCLLPTGDSSVAWTPSAGSNYQCVDDAIPGASDGDSTYVEHSAASDAIDLYTQADLPAGIVGIVGVILDLEARKTDAGALPGGGSFKSQIKHSVTTTDGAAKTLTTTYECHRTMFIDCPGSTGWTKAQVDALLAGPFFDVP